MPHRRKSCGCPPSTTCWLNRGHTPTVYFYRSLAAAGGDFFSVSRLKESMASALVPFYPLAGRLCCADGDDGHLVINCNAEGALLVVARSDDLALDYDFVDLKPTPELKTLFVPRVESSVMLGVQVTFLRCGGVALGTAFHHVAGDAVSAFHFFKTWSAFSREGGGAGAAFDPPCHDRTLLRARSPPVVHPDALSVFCRQLSLTPPSGPVVNEVFTIPKDGLAALKRTAGVGGVSTFCAVSALVWQCACVARGLRPDAKAHLTLPANIRRSVKPCLPDHYFGNAIIFLETAALVRDVTSESLAATASRIRRVIGRMDDEVARSAIDYYKLAEEDRRPPPSGSLPETELRVVSWLGMPVYEADYGWGKPEMFLGAESSRQGLVHLINDGGDGVRVLVSVEASSMEEFGRLLYSKLATSSKIAARLDKA
jgi:shikimate O-hydroxycinnamoyltransferase